MDSDTVRLADLEPAALTAAKAALEAAPPALPAAHPETAADLLFEEAARRRGADLRMRAYGMFGRGRTVAEIAGALSADGAEPVSADEVVVWARDGEWARRLRLRNDARETLVRENLRRLRIEQLEEDTAGAIRVTRKLRRRAEEMLDAPNLTAGELKSLSEVARNAGEASARAYGEADGTAAAGVAATGRQPLVMIFPNGGLPPASEKTAERL